MEWSTHLHPRGGSRSLALRRPSCQSASEGKVLRNPTVNRDSQSSGPTPVEVPASPAAALDAELRADLAELDAADLLRRLRRIEGRQGPRMRIDGRDVLLLAGANYLDLAADPRVLSGAHEALDACGAAAGGARLISGNLDLHTELERELAAFLGRPAALLFSTGYMANLGVLTALAREDDAIVSDALNHASIIDACRLSGARTHRFRHNDPEDFARVAGRLSGEGRRILVLDGVYSMDGDVAALAELAPIARAHDMLIVLDDAHGIGVLGAKGRGVAELLATEVDVVIGNLGKALGSFGAFAACSETVREWLVQRARSFIFTCALAPAAVGAARAALRVIRDEPARRSTLRARAERLRNGLAQAGFDTLRSTTHVVPALVGENARTMQLCERALARGVYAQGIRYPSVPNGQARLRLTPMCSHSEAEIDAAVALFAELRGAAWAT